MQIALSDTGELMPGESLHDGIVDTRLQQPALGRMAQIVIVQILNAGARAGIDPSMLERISILPLFEESSGDARLFPMEHGEYTLIDRQRFRYAFEPTPRSRDHPIPVCTLDQPFRMR
jgi:hypothetical protein